MCRRFLVTLVICVGTFAVATVENTELTTTEHRHCTPSNSQNGCESITGREGAPEGVYWRDYIPCEIPDDAFEVAPGLYIGQAVHQGHLLVATIYPHTGTVIAELNGDKIFKHNTKILCTMWPEKLYWESVNFSDPIRDQMKNAVRGGYSNDIDMELYIGKELVNKEWKIGKVIEITHRSKGLYVWTAGMTASRRYQFEILKYNYTSKK